ncbi:MAG TPA: RNA-binding cell elongation regulator Jag/EloR [Candidatus Acidoferrum sp.]|nr:RNA-binding cell elongation regulator Jag/EloR [Candidatus Acidoferrum sp.]
MNTNRNTVETTGKTVDEAIDKALEELEEARENVEVEVLDESADESRVRVTLRESYAIKARQVVAELLYKMGIGAQVFIKKADDPVMIDVAGDNLGLLIGWRGETLRAFQTVVNLILNEGRSDRRRLVVDVEHYRNRREETVKEMALRLADRVRRTGERVVMDPMQSYERRIVHITLEKEPGIRTESHGEEPNRRVAILPDGISVSRRPAERPAPAPAPPLPRQGQGYGDRPRYGERPRYGDRPRFGERRPGYREGDSGRDS